MSTTPVTVSQRQLDQLTIGLGRAEDEIAALRREIAVKDAALATAAVVMAEVDGLLDRYAAALNDEAAA